MKDLFKKIKSKISVKSLCSYGVNKKFVFLPLLFLVLFGVFFIAKPALAWDPIADASAIFGWIIMQVVSILGKILTWVMGLLIEIAQYNGFITAPAVSKGWIIIRDVCNMFFIAALLIIAFGTVLKVEKYSYKRTLGSILMAAVLINFSKFICGFLIDIVQILMLTFVNAFKDAAAGNFLQMLGMDKWLNFSGAKSAGTSALTGSIFALILVIISLVVISIMMVILAFRIVIIWLLVVLSPLVFVLNIFPGKGQSYSGMWWEKFTSQLIVGPVMAFFIWLSFAVASESSIVPNTSQGPSQTSGTETSIVLTDNSVSEAANPSNFAKFVVSIAMLVGSLLIAQNLGVAGGKLAGKAVGKMQAYATGEAGVLKKVKETGKLVAKGTAGAAGRLAGKTAGGLTKGLGKGLGKGAGWLGNKIDPEGKVKKVAKGASGWAKAQSEASKDRLAQGKGNILDHAVNNIGLGFKSGAAKEIAEGQAGQVKRVEDAKKRMVGKSKDQLMVISKTGTVSERQAVGVMMAESGQLKADSPENRQIIKDTQQAMKWNKPTRDSFNDHIKKNSDADMVIDTQYNGLKNEADKQRFNSDVSQGKIDLSKAIQEMSQDQIDNLVNNMGAPGDNTAAGRQVLQTLSRKQADDLGNELKETEEGQKKRDTLFNDNVINKDSSDEERLNYFKVTGRLDNAFAGQDDPKQMKSFLEKNEKLVESKLSAESLKSKDFFRTFATTMSPDFIKKMSAKQGFEEVIDSSWESAMKEDNEDPEKIHTPEAKRTRKRYIKYKKGENADAIYAGVEGTDKKSEADRMNISNDLSQEIANNDINAGDLGDIKTETLENNPEIGRAILMAADVGFLKEYMKKMGTKVKKELLKILYEMEQDKGLNKEEREHATQMLDKFDNIDSSLVPEERRIKKEEEALIEKKKKEQEDEAEEKKKEQEALRKKKKKEQEDEDKWDSQKEWL